MAAPGRSVDASEVAFGIDRERSVRFLWAAAVVLVVVLLVFVAPAAFGARPGAALGGTYGT